MEEKSHFTVIKEEMVSTPKSLQTLYPGEKVTVSCSEFASLMTVRSAASRLNRSIGFTEFEVSTPDNGATITIKRNRPCNGTA